MVKIGNFNTLKVARMVDFGAYLAAGNGIDILLPMRYMPHGLAVGDEINVFIYTDSEDRLIATTETPLIQVGEFGYLKVVDVNQIGAFLEWGLPKHLLVPFREQKTRMLKGGVYLVYVYLDDVTKRVVATTKIEKYLGNVIPDYRRGNGVDALIWQHTPIGYRAIVDNLHAGMIYDNELFRPLEIGERVKAYVKAVRNDGKIDLTLSGNIEERIASLADRLLHSIELNGGHIDLSDKSSPERIESMFQCSKKDFKKAVGHLYKERLINIVDDGMDLVR